MRWDWVMAAVISAAWLGPVLREIACEIRSRHRLHVGGRIRFFTECGSLLRGVLSPTATGIVCGPRVDFRVWCDGEQRHVQLCDEGLTWIRGWYSGGVHAAEAARALLQDDQGCT